MHEITIGRLRGGLCAVWYDADGKRLRHQLKARTRKDAEAEAAALYRSKSLNTRTPTVAEMWRAYVADLGDKPSGVSMRYAAKAVLQHFGSYRPEDVTKALCQDYDRRRREAGRAQGTVWTELGYLQSALNFGMKNAPKVWRPSKPQSDKRILTRAEAIALIDAARSPHTRLALILLLGTAARVGAVLDLKWDRVDFDRGTINLRLEDTATRKGRAIVPMNASTRAALQDARAAAISDYVIEWAGTRVNSVRKGVMSAVSAAKLGHVRIHDLRHTAAVTMLSSGVPLVKVAQVLGHSNTAVTFSTYGRYLPEHMQDAVNLLDFTNDSVAE